MARFAERDFGVADDDLRFLWVGSVASAVGAFDVGALSAAIICSILRCCVDAATVGVYTGAAAISSDRLVPRLDDFFEVDA